MVYCGKPSKSCRQCRNRNIKCDKKHPSCGQCLRATLTCPGYPDLNNLLIRNQTSITIHRVFAQQTAHIQLPTAVPNISVLDRAKCLFVSTHVFGSHPSFYYMKEFFPPRESDDFLIKTVQAVCLAYLANETGRGDVMCRARVRYSEGLVAMGRALGRRGQAGRREVIATVLLMDCFERLSQLEGDGDSRHLDGAVALCKVRGKAQFEDPVSVALFHHLSCNVLASCLSRGTEILGEYMQLRAEVAGVMLPTDSKWRAENLILDFMALRMRLRSSDEEGDELWEGLKKEYRELCKVFSRVRDDEVMVSPAQKRNILCSLREMMDGLFGECDELMKRREMAGDLRGSENGEGLLVL
ncbi:uncharacterized protein LY89DRAFT_739086 [Mollisia scopiformis]|uniref:Zn(2)-C6 fungal-type domain-containing protein n=1 Tax=Mollisia scopiformis TaxID=149040 RepID=A0A194WUM5_MOLSC|nr:uncharacterized protein LY89DRAFT_739086 [Mollisia scopiformis]KUJ11663.1 hypothetical protein LY89DRAFT_739086 [Mollisia scopiformis]